MQKKSFRFGKKVCVGSTLNLSICSIFWGNFEGILGNPGEIPHIGRKTLGVYRLKVGNKTNNILFNTSSSEGNRPYRYIWKCVQNMVH